MSCFADCYIFRSEFRVPVLVLCLVLVIIPIPVMSADIGDEWVLTTDNPGFGQRIQFTTLEYNGYLWVIGGRNPDLNNGNVGYGEVWKSQDGVTWELVTSNPAFGTRAYHGSVVYNNYMWVIGGQDTETWEAKNDAWYSSDGITWIRAIPSNPSNVFSPRHDSAVTVYNGKMWVIGGYLGNSVDDVWYSTNGGDWYQSTSDIPGVDSLLTPSVVSFYGKIWLFGAWKKSGSSYIPDIWSYSDESGWTEEVQPLPFPNRMYPRTIVYNNKIWVIGGISIDSGAFLNDVWSSPDGITWTRVTEHADFSPRWGHTLAAFDDHLWVISGRADNDVWRSGISVIPVEKTFSITDTAYRTDKNAQKGDLMDTAKDNCNYLENELKSRGWEDPVFNKQGSAVTKADFNINPESGHTTLNSAVLHFHTGHGSELDSYNRTNLALLDQNNEDYSFNALDVTGKWGGNNKWVILDSCYLMLDEEWGNALATSHGVLGFKTQVRTPSRFTTRFVEYAIDDEKTLYEAYRRTTYEFLKDSLVPYHQDDVVDTEKVIAAVIFKDRNQAKYDYLPGVKTGVYTGPLFGGDFVKDWHCDEPPKGVD